MSDKSFLGAIFQFPEMRGQMNRRQENSSAILRPFLSVKETFASNLFPLTHRQLLPFGFPMMRFCIELSFPRFTEVTLSCMESFHPGGVASSRVLIYLNQVFLSPCGFLSRLALHFFFTRNPRVRACTANWSSGTAGYPIREAQYMIAVSHFFLYHG